NQRHQEIPETSRDIEDDDLLRSSNFFDVKDIKKFVKIDDSRYLQSVMDKYQHSDSDAQTIAFHVLRAWVRKNPSITKEKLKRKLNLMNFEEAADNLSEPTQLAQATQANSAQATSQATQTAQSNTKCFVL
uniref:Death domain-containing protein n=1 Tax=Amphimedon queenslandica TaxID=400682 RepID=A0A1X7STV2_AMPQE